jgi:hypothetical protein
VSPWCGLVQPAGEAALQARPVHPCPSVVRGSSPNPQTAQDGQLADEPCRQCLAESRHVIRDRKAQVVRHLLPSATTRATQRQKVDLPEPAWPGT